MAVVSHILKRPTFIALIFVTCGLLAFNADSAVSLGAPLLQEISDQENAIAQTATNAQNAGDFPLAASQWEQLLKDFPNTSLTGLAQHNLGVCYVQTGQFKKAADALKSSLRTLDKKETEKLARSFLFLGFSQARLGKEIGETASDATTTEESRKWLTTATQTFEQLQKRFPDFADLDQALYFQGEAYSLLGRFDKASQSYEKMLTLPNRAFKFDGLIALADVYDQLGNFDKAIEYYDLFQTEAKAAGGHELQGEASYRKAETLLKLAAAAEKQGQAEEAQKNYAAAEKLFAIASQDPIFDIKDRAIFQQAYAANRQRQFEKSAGIYSKVAQIKDSPLAARAQVYSGRDYLSANQGGQAEAELKKAITLNSPFAAEGAHWLAQLYLRTKRNDEAFELANQWIENTPSENRMLVTLKLDRADAAYLITERRAQSPELFLEIADSHPDDLLAPTALYNAAFAFLETGRFDEAVQMADRFQNNYKSSDYLADTLEVKADASLLSGAPQTAESVFRRLAQEYPANPKASIWKLRVGLAQYMQKKYQDTIDWLGPNSDHITEKSQLAEALHWIGASHFNLDQDDEAMTALQQSINTDPAWRRADETLLTLSRAQYRAGKSNDAELTMGKLLQLFPNSATAAQAYYLMGEMAFARNDFDVAESNYQTVIKNHPKSEFLPHALYGAAWSLIEQKQFAQSTELFDRLINEFSNHERAGQAKIGRGVSRRLAGDSAGAVVDLNEFLGTGPIGQPEIDALYELGLAQVELKKWPEVAATFGSLIDKAPDSKMADRYHYELAWAHQSNDDDAQSLRHFRILADQFTDSPLAPEANFHVANAAYDQKDFGAAIKSYAQCVNSQASDSLREKAAYKQAWSHYKQKDYDKALELFENQIKEFPEGNLQADGLLMVSDSLYRLEKHDEAFEAYLLARPAIEASKTVDARVRWQALLHGGQSANKAGRFDEAIEFVQPIVDSNVTSDALKQDAYLEIGTAHKGNRDSEAALAAWEKAAVNTAETGAEARCMIGELLFKQRRFDDAINAYKLVFYGYGGKQAVDDIKPWQAFAVFEAAQCNFVQIKEADPQLRPKLIEEARKHFQYLLDNYPNDRLVNEATKRLDSLKQLK